jgi:hypothetical protein
MILVNFGALFRGKFWWILVHYYGEHWKIGDFGWLYYYDDNFGEVGWFFGLKLFNIFYSSNSSFLKTWKFEAARYLEINANEFYFFYQCVQDFYNFIFGMIFYLKFSNEEH